MPEERLPLGGLRPNEVGLPIVGRVLSCGSQTLTSAAKADSIRIVAAQLKLRPFKAKATGPEPMMSISEMSTWRVIS